MDLSIYVTHVPEDAAFAEMVMERLRSLGGISFRRRSVLGGAEMSVADSSWRIEFAIAASHALLIIGSVDHFNPDRIFKEVRVAERYRRRIVFLKSGFYLYRPLTPSRIAAKAFTIVYSDPDSIQKTAEA